MRHDIEVKWTNICKKNNFEEMRGKVDDLLYAINSIDPTSKEFINLTKEYNQISKALSRRFAVESDLEELEFYEECMEEDLAYYEPLYDNLAKEVYQELNTWEMELLFTGKYDNSNVYLTIHAGSGGTEAQDWAEMLSRMYIRWAEQHCFVADIVDSLNGETAGLKSITLHIKGDYAYGFLRSEHGVHRLVRVSPFDAKNRRHTSFAAVEVLPELPPTEAPPLNFSEIEIQTFRSGGPGGQYQNTTDSGCRLIHKPTGIVVESRQERSQMQNRTICETMLAAKLVKLQEEQQQAEVEDLKGEQTEAGWGHSIRSYVFMPYQMVKDHRTDYETGKVNAVLDGDLDGFIKEYLLND